MIKTIKTDATVTEFAKAAESIGISLPELVGLLERMFGSRLPERAQEIDLQTLKSTYADFFNPTVLHYHRSEDIERSMDTGAAITALCGLRGAVGASAERSSKPGRTVVCPLCATVFAELPQAGRK
ncbi:DUF3039 domain-containing protein [Arthrobacter sp. 1P04PC]|uniref:DUF3039 domain-containing protein n=1 Tax=unclassified Arthrobacter TaxID=235627 RepID=UPI00399F9ABF